jgi:glutathionylspermidine synthase
MSLEDKILFDYYLVSSIRERDVFFEVPFYIDREIFEEMVFSTKVLDGLVKKVIDKIIKKQKDIFYEFDTFPLIDTILDFQMPQQNYFWVRYDAFQRRDGGIFFSEFNYDKPCAQREILLSAFGRPLNNPSLDFANQFKAAFIDQCKKYNFEKPCVAVLVDPAHFEELHLAYLYKDLLKECGCDFIICGAKNFEVKNEKVYVFNKKIDVIIRQYPTEFLHEVNNIERILELYKQEKILILNDVRAIFGQAKSLFAKLWEMVENKDVLLSSEEECVIKKTIPYTTLFSNDKVQELLKNKDSYVIKSIYGRYSNEVYIGAMHTQEEWAETIEYVASSERKHIIQEFCAIKPENVLMRQFGKIKSVEAFPNYGIYLANSEYAGACVRWSSDYLTSDHISWTTPLGVREESIQIKPIITKDRQETWQRIKDKAAFDYGYTGGYTGNLESFSSDGLILTKRQLSELKSATMQAVHIFEKTVDLMRKNLDFFGPVLNMSKNLIELVKQDFTKQFYFTGRMDWAYDRKGELKLLEFNSETPGGLLESIGLQKSIEETVKCKFSNPNKLLGNRIRKSFENIIHDYKLRQPVRNIGFVSSSYYEDWYNTNQIYELVKDMPYNFILGEISGLRVKNEKLYLYEMPIDAVYRHYPLDWLDKDDYYDGVLHAFMKKTLSINPPITYLSQSKSVFSVIWELLQRGFFTQKEHEFIKKHIPRTSLDPNKLGTLDYCIKSFFGFEGQEVYFNIDNPILEEGDYIYQERIDIQTVDVDVYNVISGNKEIAYPIIGCYVTGDKFSGILSRVGGAITDKWAQYLPTFIQ